MAAAVPDAAVGFLLENLRDFVTYNTDLIAGAEDNANKLCSELEILRGYLKKCTEYSNDEFLDKLAKDVRKLVYRAEDAIETYIATASKHKARGTFKGAFHAIDHAMDLRSIGKELENIIQEVQRLYTTKVNLGFQAMQVDKGQEPRMKKPPVDDDMVGFKDAMSDVMNFLNEGPEDLQTISIVGMLGLGKTTLARQIFKHPTVEYQFFIRAFVEVSQDYKKREVFLKLLRAFGIKTDEMNRMHDDDLQHAITKYLENRNFLIVLDDVWTPETWDDLRRCFPNNQKHSRVLLTTRHKNVAEHARQGLLGFKPYDLRFLTPEESRELLRKRVFGNDEIRSDLEVHETAILARCDGLPLAIVVVAGILTNHREEDYWWKRVAQNMHYNIVSTADQATNVIKLSFDNLPYRLKPCFLYLGVFREDSEILMKSLLKLWVSEGFAPPADGKAAEDIAEDYLEELVDRSLVMVERRRLNGRIKTIRIHDTLREFCKVQAKKEELFREIKNNEQSRSISPDADRRLCINYDVLKYITSKNKPSGKHVRSFLSFAKEDYVLPLEYISEIPKNFKLLRVLDVRSIKFTRFPTELFYTFLLKYIAMCGELKVIPEKVSNLRYLQTLIFNTTQRNLEIKADIWKMKQLRHLETNTSTRLLKTKEDRFENENLQTLSAISPESCTSDVFERAPQLRKLGICGTLASVLEATGSGSLFDSLSKLDFLENLKLLNDTIKVRSLPNENRFPTNLTRLTLQNTMLGWEQISTLAKLRKLEVLKLKDNAFLGAFWDTESTGAFSALKVLFIGSTDLITWKASKNHFPKLTSLYLRHCTKLEAIPSDLVNISVLQLIDIYCCNRDVSLSARKLQLAKLQVHARDKDDKGTLKLFIYPPDQ